MRWDSLNLGEKERNERVGKRTGRCGHLAWQIKTHGRVPARLPPSPAAAPALTCQATWNDIGPDATSVSQR